MAGEVDRSGRPGRFLPLFHLCKLRDPASAAVVALLLSLALTLRNAPSPTGLLQEGGPAAQATAPQSPYISLLHAVAHRQAQPAGPSVTSDDDVLQEASPARPVPPTSQPRAPRTGTPSQSSRTAAQETCPSQSPSFSAQNSASETLASLFISPRELRGSRSPHTHKRSLQPPRLGVPSVFPPRVRDSPAAVESAVDLLESQPPEAPAASPAHVGDLASVFSDGWPAEASLDHSPSKPDEVGKAGGAGEADAAGETDEAGKDGRAGDSLDLLLPAGEDVSEPRGGDPRGAQRRPHEAAAGSDIADSPLATPAESRRHFATSEERSGREARALPRVPEPADSTRADGMPSTQAAQSTQSSGARLQRPSASSPSAENLPALETPGSTRVHSFSVDLSPPASPRSPAAPPSGSLSQPETASFADDSEDARLTDSGGSPSEEYFHDEEGSDEVLLTMTTENSQMLLRRHRQLVVFFFVPWCERCQKFFPEVFDAAARLRRLHPPIRVATVDSAANEELARRFHASGVPEIRLVGSAARTRDASPSSSSPASASASPAAASAAPSRSAGEQRASASAVKQDDGGRAREEAKIYGGAERADDLVRWAMKNAGPAAYVLKDFDAAHRFLFDHPVTLLGLFEDGSAAKDVFLRAAHKILEVSTAISSSAEVAEKLAVKAPQIVLFRPYGETKILFRGNSAAPNEDEIAQFVRDHWFPAVVLFDASTSADLFADGRPLLLLVRADDEEGMQAEAALHDVAAAHRSVLLSAISGSKGAFAAQLMNFLNLRRGELPAAVIVENAASQISRIQFVHSEGPLTRASLGRFISAYFQRALEPLRKSERPPTVPLRGNIHKLVGSTFFQLATRPEVEMLLFVHAPWCAHSAKLRPVFEEVAARLAHVPNFVAAELDGSANEVEDLNVVSHRSLLELQRRAGPRAKNGDALLRPPTPVATRTADAFARWEADDRDTVLTDLLVIDGYPALVFYGLPPGAAAQPHGEFAPEAERGKKPVILYDGVRDVPSILEFLLANSDLLKREHLHTSQG
ncbi:seryl-tRNA synthetase (SerRS2) [Besnoitia besnoiti]|uniref:Seryl-tRNA synthetase (SerRS2) n=1 Tax=Besnoitia besnoiti TaxID=94643 RepID=A0A2A9MMI1_BESBE|nr:seryl-tRNA synthetase (SerRS2) [Besnoitia besnoiti]PFH37316.1 seryl-tRNA synthetase (SerRS2) [Besnoitia besnoiti]